jgi:hypothetical protein
LAKFLKALVDVDSIFVRLVAARGEGSALFCEPSELLVLAMDETSIKDTKNKIIPNRITRFIDFHSILSFFIIPLKVSEEKAEITVLFFLLESISLPSQSDSEKNNGNGRN